MKKILIIFLSFVSIWTNIGAQVGAFGLEEFSDDINRIIVNFPRNSENKLIIQVSPFQEEPKGKYAWSEKYTIQFINDSVFREKFNMRSFPYYWLIRNDSILSYDMKSRTANPSLSRYPTNPDSLGYECFEGIGWGQKKFKNCRKRDASLRTIELIYMQDSLININRFEYPNSNVCLEKQYSVNNTDTVLMTSIYQFTFKFQNQQTIADTTIIRRYHDDTNPKNIILTVRNYNYNEAGEITDIEKCLYYDNSATWAQRSIMKVIRKKKK